MCQTSSASSTRRRRRKPTGGTPTRTTTAARPELLPRDEVARAINAEVKAGRGAPAGGVYLDVSTRLPADVIIKKLPSMHHQFRELADVDITAQPMEVGPTCHYVMGGVEVAADTTATLTVDGLFAAGEVSGGMHGSNRLGGNSLSDLLVFGSGPASTRPGTSTVLATRGRRRPGRTSTPPSRWHWRRWTEAGGENPYDVIDELQQVMQDLVGIIRRRHELEESLKRLADLRERAANVTATGGRRYNPGWHLALDLRNMLLVSECTARAALEREESRGGHTREDFPAMNPQWRKTNLVCALDGGEVRLTAKPVPAIPPELAALFDRGELAKYLTEEELVAFDAAGAEKGGR